MKNNWIAIVALAIAAAALGLWWNGERQRQLLADRLDVVQREKEQARQGEVKVAEESAEDKAIPSAPVIVAGPKSNVDVGPYLKMIDDLRAKAEQYEKELAEVQRVAARAEAKASEEGERAERAASLYAALKEEAAQTRRIAEVYEEELKVKTKRLTTAETAEKLLQERLTQSEQASRRVVTVSKEIEDLNRRREEAITALQQRYREVTDLYRNFALNSQNREGGQAGQGMQAGDLSRIQSVLQQAEDELQQLRRLNGRVAELARKK